MPAGRFSPDETARARARAFASIAQANADRKLTREALEFYAKHCDACERDATARTMIYWLERAAHARKLAREA